MSLEAKIRELEDEIKRTPYNKATEHHIGRAKAKLARLREEAIIKSSSGKGGVKEGVKKSGDATVVLVGFPSVGKSTLLTKLTNAESKIAEYDFTTLEVIPGMMEYRGARIQILDVPGLIKGASSGKGRGKEVISVVRTADLLLLFTDVFSAGQVDIIEKELYAAGVRLNTREPNIGIEKKTTGGIEINSTLVLKNVDERTIKSVLEEYRIRNANVLIREDITLDRLIDALSKNRVYLPALLCINKIDLASKELLNELEKKFPAAVKIAAEKEVNLEKLREAIYNKLGFINIYLKPPGKEADYNSPMILRKGAKIEELCEKLHRNIKKEFKHALIWGSSAKHPGQRVGLEHVLSDRDVVTIMLKRH